ncbi:coenzyme-B sulfoethylthiotransferase subunit alpha [Methanonatronarchaeum sp. AMET6-2]|uniref:coenzyme-B sulfoethylthiotransferase subunit alpha n=1 Tax=Methanonatronarchaeum sp. AMET6-2 TaxID=2933293 RepID=UPI0011FB9F18|nr:coenzyme-B sulfoethylthiotransferase subunit alpha [Methanonatronarchaeum sp. AMET6-2]RZN61136.1 MAG: coenzyme-B sulfoethylthiotransferase subunit alpha [Methanonatronarchaeia archaeon]UOY09806.1 coenzyme-B sulfoethylthiotransferase subunit alpha [Methanonatronarchaeum sp. AMET6-2]
MADEEKRFIKALKNKFEEEPTDTKTHFYDLGGYKQSERKKEFQERAAQIAKERGTPSLNEDIGVPLGQRVLMPYQLSHTDMMVEPDDLHVINNAAMQQAWDDIQRTVIVGLDTAHQVLEKRLGVEVTPETINEYLEVYNHTQPGGAVVQEHMAECNPGVTGDAYVKVFTGNDELADEIDDRFLIDINENFPEDQAEQLKEAIGDSLWQAVRAPTIVTRVMDGATIRRWAAMQSSMAFISSYSLCAGEAAIADFAYASKHSKVVNMASAMPRRRARGENEPGGIPFGYMGDIAQSFRTNPDDPSRATLETITLAAVIYDQLYLGGYMSGGVGFTQDGACHYTDDILEDFVYYGEDLIRERFDGLGKAPLDLNTISKISTEVNDYAISCYEDYPGLMETHFGGSQRAAIAGIAAGVTVGHATGHSQAGLSGWFLSQNQHKERCGRLGFYGYDLQDQSGFANTFSYRNDESNPLEIRGPNFPNAALNTEHMPAYAGISTSSHVSRGDAWVCNPLVKVAFSDDALSFDFANINEEVGRGGLREFEPEGERSGVISL